MAQRDKAIDVMEHTGIIYKIANNYRHYCTGSVALDDLVQEGYLGALKAKSKFDPKRGVRFTTYMVGWVRAYIWRYLTRRHQVTAHEGTRRKAGKMEVFIAAHYKMHGRCPSDEEIAAAVETRVSTLWVLRAFPSIHLSLEDVQRSEGRQRDRLLTYEGTLQSDLPLPDEALAVRRQRAAVWRIVESVRPALTEREQFLVERRLLTVDPLTLREIGEHFGISRERVRQIEKEVKRRLWCAIREQASELQEVG